MKGEEVELELGELRAVGVEVEDLEDESVKLGDDVA